MQISMLLCDYACLNQDGTVDLIRGGIDRVRRKIGDPLHFQGFLSVHIRSDLDDIGKEYGSSITIVDTDGAMLGPPICGAFSFPPGNGPEKIGKIVSHNIVAGFQTVFPKPGKYEFRFRVNGEQKAVWPLEVCYETGQAQQGSFEPVQPWKPS